MKSLKKHIIFYLFLAGISVNAQNQSQISTNLSIWGSAAYGNFTSQTAGISSDGIFLKGLGIGLEWWYNSFLFGLGGEYNHINSNITMSDFNVSIDNLIDSEGDVYRGNFIFSNINDSYNMGYINVPVILGLQNRNAYILMKGTFGLNITGNSKISSNILSSGTYPQFIEDFENMPNHFFYQKDISKRNEIKFNPTYMASLELGFYLGGRKTSFNKNVSYRLALTCDYTLNNLNTTNGNQDFILNQSEYGFDPVLNNLLLTNKAVSLNIKPVYIGAKFTVLFKMKNKNICRCDW